LLEYAPSAKYAPAPILFRSIFHQLFQYLATLYFLACSLEGDYLPAADINCNVYLQIDLVDVQPVARPVTQRLDTTMQKSSIVIMMSLPFFSSTFMSSLLTRLQSGL
jgi:hypothetical protein